MNIIFFGAPGSGKSTQAQKLAEKLNLPHLATGDLFRNLEDDNSELGQRIGNVFRKGLLVADDDVVAVVGRKIVDSKYSRGVVLDGFQRTLPQVENSPIKFDKAIYLNISDETAVKRLASRGRVDETPEVIRERLKVYHLQTEPVLNYYRQRGNLVEINGEPTEPEIFNEIIQKLGII